MARGLLLVALSLTLMIVAGCRNTAQPVEDPVTADQQAEGSSAVDGTVQNLADPIDSEEEPAVVPEILADFTDVPAGSCFSVNECPRIRFTCADGLASFDNSGTDTCWCGCMAEVSVVEEVPAENSGTSSFDPFADSFLSSETSTIPQ